MAGDELSASVVFAPILKLTVTIETGGDDGPDEIHIHPAGQGIWVGRLLASLGERPVLCGPLGGEPGVVISRLALDWGISIDPVPAAGASPTILQDRRGGERVTLFETPPVTLGRHELDDAYGRVLGMALSARVCVITGQDTEIVPIDTFRRLGRDLAMHEVPVVADLHGRELEAFLDRGRIDVLKVSDEDLRADGVLTDGSEASSIAAVEDLVERGAKNVVLSRSDRPALAMMESRLYRVLSPPIEPAEPAGAGDSMTAGIAAAIGRGMDPISTLRLASGAGAANATRHGLGSASKNLIMKLAERVEIEPIGS